MHTSKPIDLTPAWIIYKGILPEFSLHGSVYKMTRTVAKDLAECLTSEKRGFQIVLLIKNIKSLNDPHKSWPLVRSGIIALGECPEKVMENLDNPGKFRELEVGVGTSIMTIYVVRHLPKLDIPLEYVFKDLSASHVAAAKRTFKNWPEIESTTLDVEKEPTGSWVHTFPVVISRSYIHTTRNLTKLLTTTWNLLRDDGVVTLAVLTQDMFWLHIAVRLFEVWRMFEDGRELLRYMSRFGRTHDPSGFCGSRLGTC